ncbi:MAG: glycosyltransferase [Kiritimatiellae bacterium]|nr:glycosyltransferase [Kiritimatiellia bacterium]
MSDRILFVSPGYFRGDDAPHMLRDAFRYVRHLETKGASARLLLLLEPGCSAEPCDHRLSAAPYEKWIDSAFWRSWDVGIVMMYSYGVLSPHAMLLVFQAIRDAGCRIVFQMDAGLGLPAFPYRIWTLLKRRYWWARWRNRSVFSSAVRAIAQIVHWAEGSTARFVCRELLPLCDSIRVESPVAMENTRKRLRALGRPEAAERVVFAVHPVPDAFAWNDSVHKEKVILCVSRDWKTPLKGGRILAKAFLDILPGSGWKAVVIGDHSKDVFWDSGRISSFVTTCSRIHPDELSSHFLRSSILVTASGAEAAPIVVSEALAAGCSIVFPPELAQLEPLVHVGFASMSRHRTACSLATALRTEMLAWNDGRRDPKNIFEKVGWKGLVSNLWEELRKGLEE